jgi:hypothetical protein
MCGRDWAVESTYEGPPADWSMAMTANSVAPCAVMIQTVMCPIHLVKEEYASTSTPSLGDGQVIATMRWQMQLACKQKPCWADPATGAQTCGT